MATTLDHPSRSTTVMLELIHTVAVRIGAVEDADVLRPPSSVLPSVPALNDVGKTFTPSSNTILLYFYSP